MATPKPSAPGAIDRFAAGLALIRLIGIETAESSPYSCKRAGIQQLEIAAKRGHHPLPFAKIFLALAAPRENKTEVARAQPKELVAESPENPLSASELAKLNVPPAAAIAPKNAFLPGKKCFKSRCFSC
jgi:hypothetical protein